MLLYLGVDDGATASFDFPLILPTFAIMSSTITIPRLLRQRSLPGVWLYALTTAYVAPRDMQTEATRVLCQVESSILFRSTLLDITDWLHSLILSCVAAGRLEPQQVGSTGGETG